MSTTAAAPAAAAAAADVVAIDMPPIPAPVVIPVIPAMAKIVEDSSSDSDSSISSSSGSSSSDGLSPKDCDGLSPTCSSTSDISISMDNGLPKFDSTHHLKVLSLNIFTRPNGIKELRRKGDMKSARLRFLREQLAQYHVVCLQELFAVGNKRHRRFLRDAFRMGFRYFITSKPPKFFSGHMIDGGVVILSRFPIKRRNQMIFSCGKGADALASKGALHAEIELQKSPRIRLNVFATHLQSEYCDTIGRAQIKQLQQFISDIAGDSPYPILIAGDFNLDSRFDKDGYKYLCDHMNNIRFSNSLDSAASACSSLNSTRPLMKPSFGSADTPSTSASGSALSSDGSPQTPRFLIPHDENATIDIMKESYGFHPVTNGWGHAVVSTPKDKWLKEPEGVEPVKERHCIDYMFFRRGLEDGTGCSDAVYPDLEASRVRPFFTDKHKFTQISDHYGTECTLMVASNKPPCLPDDSTPDDKAHVEQLSRCAIWRWKPCILIALILLTLFGLVGGAITLGLLL